MVVGQFLNPFWGGKAVLLAGAAVGLLAAG
jgi:hypothetical protein